MMIKEKRTLFDNEIQIQEPLTLFACFYMEYLCLYGMVGSELDYLLSTRDKQINTYTQTHTHSLTHPEII